jgi:hypothetical protein
MGPISEVNALIRLPHRHVARSVARACNATTPASIEAAVARLIPADNQLPGGLEAGVPNYIDKQLGGAWGAGERLYRNGPWQPGTPSTACR